MKRFFMLIAAVASVAAVIGCSVDKDNCESSLVQKRAITVQATHEEDVTFGISETKTMRNEKTRATLWCKGDRISLFYGFGSDGGSIFTSTQQEDTLKITNFSGNISVITGGADVSVDQTYFWALYPYDPTAVCDGQSITFNLPSSQEAVPGTFANNLFPSMGKSQGLIMGFYNICGGFRFSVNKEGIRKATFKGNNNEYLAGKVNASFISGYPSAHFTGGGYAKELVLSAPNGKTFEPGKYYYFVMLPTTFSNGFTVTVETYTEEAVFEFTDAIAVTRSNFKSKTNMDSGLEYTRKTGAVPIEDPFFKSYLVSMFDTDDDGELSYEEALAITSLSTTSMIATKSGNTIESLQGIEYMLNLETLECFSPITSLDVSNNAALKKLILFGTNLTNLDLSNNVNLEYLWCEDNTLTDIDISNNVGLKSLTVSGDNLSSLDVSENTLLEKINCTNNNLKTLDVSNNTALKYLECSMNQLTSLDISHNAVLEVLSANMNGFTSLDVSNNPKLRVLEVSNNPIGSLDITNNPAMGSLLCSQTGISELDLSNNPSIYELSCSSNNLSELDLSVNSGIVNLYCANNKLTELSVSNLGNLYRFDCSNNLLSSIDITAASILEQFYCYGNRLTSLDVSKNLALAQFDCSPMDVSGVNVLEVVYIYEGQSIHGVTTNRSSLIIPDGTDVRVAPTGGGGEGTGDDEL